MVLTLFPPHMPLPVPASASNEDGLRIVTAVTGGSGKHGRQLLPRFLGALRCLF